MTDRELLEAAALAVGQERSAAGDLWSNARGQLWNPLADDGDALRLAVKLRIRIAGMDQRACAFIGLQEFWEPEGDDPCAATRRAIVRAAAALAETRARADEAALVVARGRH